MRVLLADDHALFKEGLRNLLTARGIDVVGMASDGIEALEQARALRPDIVLMDIQMPRCNGLTATRLIKTEMPNIKIVMLTTSASDDDLTERTVNYHMREILQKLHLRNKSEVMAYAVRTGLVMDGSK